MKLPKLRTDKYLGNTSVQSKKHCIFSTYENTKTKKVIKIPHKLAVVSDMCKYKPLFTSIYLEEIKQVQQNLSRKFSLQKFMIRDLNTNTIL